MLRAEKSNVVASLQETFNATGVVVVAHYQGLNVAEMTDLRRKMRAGGAGFRVAKNRLVKLALDGTPFAPATELFTGPTAIGFSLDPTAAPKVLSEYAKKNDKLKIIGGGFGGTLLDPAAVKALAELPSIDELRSRLLGLLNAPAAKLLRQLQAPAQNLVGVLQAKADKESN
ncbi:MAG: 50S ribosomal protein L10 [Geminicoccaceae bacterium]|nr:MAG: 50S ribosomal protein L10 [Geminicoccaceae bacterium]